MNSSLRFPEDRSLPTVGFNIRLIRYQWRTFLVHTLFTLVVFGLQVAPGLIVKSIFDGISGEAGPAAVSR